MEVRLQLLQVYLLVSFVSVVLLINDSIPTLQKADVNSVMTGMSSSILQPATQ